MEPITHLLTGAVLSRTGFNRKAASMTAAMVVAAEFPDIDVAWGILGPVVGFQHHRGITHTYLGIAVEAVILASVFSAFDRWRSGGKATASWGWLYAGTLVALLSHLLLDWTNNYGVRPMFPFDPHWYAGSFVFIFEPVMFGLLLLALVAPMLFGLINSEVGASNKKFRGRGWAIAALLGVAALFGFRYVEHGKALQIALDNAPPGTTSVFASPHPINPFAWSTVSATPDFYQLGTVDSLRGIAEPVVASDKIYPEPVKLATLVAKRSELGQPYLDWSMYPVLTETSRVQDENHPWTDVTFSDARFMYNVFGFGGRDKPAMTGVVTLDMSQSEGHRVLEMRMGERTQAGDK